MEILLILVLLMIVLFPFVLGLVWIIAALVMNSSEKKKGR